MPQEQALIEAGYSPNYAASKAYKVIKKPYIQSIFTEALERVMKLRNKEFDAIIAPYIDALDAPLVVKSTTEGIACIAKDPETQEVIPDHDARMKAADRLVDLYGGKAKTDDDEPDTGTKRVFIRKYVTVEVDHVHHVAGGNAGINGVRDSGAVSSEDGAGAGLPTVADGASLRSGPDGPDASPTSAGERASLSQSLPDVSAAPAPANVTTEVLQHDEHRSPVKHDVLLKRVVRRQILPGVHDAQRDGADDL
jgi:hypothetical protein